MNHEQSLSDADFAKLRSIVHKNTGITIAENRRGMLFSRLQRRLRETGTPTFGDYIARVTSDKEEMQELTNRVTTNETYCYRTPRVWAHLREVVLPEILTRPGARQMKLWSAAASTGEEAHTIAAIMEDVRSKTPGFNYSVLGTDISSRVIAIAEEGCYVGRAVARFKREEPELFAKQMVGDDTSGYHLNPEAKKKIAFRRHNLLERLKSGGPFDVVFLRNVLIYFTVEDQEKILANVHEAMRPDATLIIGESETLSNMNCKFEPVAPFIYRATRTVQKASSS
jgi:chemotaxis protein methyltransferase CheR